MAAFFRAAMPVWAAFPPFSPLIYTSEAVLHRRSCCSKACWHCSKRCKATGMGVWKRFGPPAEHQEALGTPYPTAILSLANPCEITGRESNSPADCTPHTHGRSLVERKEARRAHSILTCTCLSPREDVLS